MKKETKKAPTIRFRGFTDNWEQRKLGELVQITMGQSPNGTTYSEKPSKYILIQGNADLKNGWVVPRIWTTQKTKFANAGDLIMSVRAPAGAMGKTAYDVVIGRGVAAIKGNEFIFQALAKMNANGYWKKIAAGSTFESINSDAVRNAEIVIPHNKEQEKIGQCFLNLDNLITIHQRKLDQLKTLKKYFLQNMFPAKGEKVPIIRFKGFTGDWEQRKFGELYKVNSGYAFRYEDYCLDGVALINGESIQHGVIDGTNLNYLPQNFLNEFSEFTLKEGDIVLGLNRPVTNGQLKMARISKQYNNSLLYQRAGKITFKKKMDENFSYVLLSNEILKYTVKEAVGSDQPFISTSKLSDWNMNIPDNIQEQKSIGTFFASLDKAITLHQRKLEQLQTMKKFMLQNLFI